MTGNAVVVNFSGGETSPRSRGRFDQPWYQTSARKLLNYVSDVQGPARFRPGFVFARQTRGGAAARLVEFQLSDVLGYVLEFTAGYMRVYSPETQDLLTTTVANISAITNASPGVITVSSATGLVNGQEVLIAGIVGMPELNNRQAKIAGLSGSTFHLVDSVTGASIDTRGFGTYSSLGTISVVYEVATPYTAVDLASLQWAQTSSTLYLVTPTVAAYKVTVDSANNFTLAAVTFTNNPFTAGAQLSLTAITLGTRTRIQFTDGDTIHDTFNYTFSAVGGTTELNANTYKLTPVTSETSGSYQYGVEVVLFTLSGIAGVADGGQVKFTGVTGGIAAYLNGVTFYVKFVQQNADNSKRTYHLYTDAAMTIPAVYTGSADGSFDTQSGGVSGTITGTATDQTTFNPYTMNLLDNWTSSSPSVVTYTHPTAYLKNKDTGVDIDSSLFTAYTTGGKATPPAENPLSVAFYEGRIVYGGTTVRPDCLFLSRLPDSSGNARYDDFTGGTAADFACFFQLAPTGGSVPYISWTRGGPDYLFLGTFGGPYRVSGSGLDIPITPSSINVRQFDTAGAEETMPAGLAQIFFIQRSGKTLRSVKVINPYLATFESADMCLNAEQVCYSALQRIALQHGRPDMLWGYREDGLLTGLSVHLTVQTSDTLTGWHRHQLGGTDAKVVDLTVVPQQASFDQLWAVVQRTINGATRCYVEIMADDVVFPDPEDFYGKSGPIVTASSDPQQSDSSASEGSRAADLALWANAVYRYQEDYVHMDSEVAYDGSLRGVTAAATLTPSAVGAVQVAGASAVPITLTASQAVFTSSDVGSEIWVKPSKTTGQGAGRATITAYTSPTQVTAVVTVSFSSTDAIAAGDWYFAVSTFYGFGHLEGETVSVVGDGAVFADGGQTGDTAFPTITVAQGTVTLPAGDLGQQPRAAFLRVGLPYTGILETHNLEMGGRSGPAESKPRNISEIMIRFLSSLGCEYGTSLYNMQKVEHRLSDANYDRPAPVFSGLRRVKLDDSWSGLDDATREKVIFVTQRLPLPSVVQFLDIQYDTTDERGMD